MADVYEIVDWEKHFENGESRKYKHLRWVATPNAHDGRGFKRLAALDQDGGLFAAWNLILQVASKMPKRGLLAKDGEPLDAEELSVATGYPSGMFSKAMEVLSDKARKIQWLSVHPVDYLRKFPEACGDSGATGTGTGIPDKEDIPEEGDAAPSSASPVPAPADETAALIEYGRLLQPLLGTGKDRKGDETASGNWWSEGLIWMRGVPPDVRAQRWEKIAAKMQSLVKWRGNRMAALTKYINSLR